LPEDEGDFTGVTVLCVVVCAVPASFAGDGDFVVLEFAVVDFVAVDCIAALDGIAQTHKPPARKNPPAARRIIVFVLLNAPR
jgi:hypothetical protein